MRGALAATLTTGQGGASRHPHAFVLVAATLLAGIVWASGCGDGVTEPSPPDPAQPTTVTVSPVAAELAFLGATVRLSADPPRGCREPFCEGPDYRRRWFRLSPFLRMSASPDRMQSEWSSSGALADSLHQGRPSDPEMEA